MQQCIGATRHRYEAWRPDAAHRARGRVDERMASSYGVITSSRDSSGMCPRGRSQSSLAVTSANGSSSGSNSYDRGPNPPTEAPAFPARRSSAARSSAARHCGSPTATPPGTSSPASPPVPAQHRPPPTQRSPRSASTARSRWQSPSCATAPDSPHGPRARATADHTGIVVVPTGRSPHPRHRSMDLPSDARHGDSSRRWCAELIFGGALPAAPIWRAVDAEPLLHGVVRSYSPPGRLPVLRVPCR
jgi:hypothetical protein